MRIPSERRTANTGFSVFANAWEPKIDRMVGTGTRMFCFDTQTSDTSCDRGELVEHSMQTSSPISS